MIPFTLQEIYSALNLPTSKEIFSKTLITNITIDSRTVKKGDVFVAITGENFDGHDFIEQAQTNGAVAIVSSKTLDNCTLPLLQVPNTRIALGQIAKMYREKFSIPFIGITGSCGKTSTRAFTASVLSQKAPTLASVGSFNNDIGVPLTLFRLDKKDQFAVIEMGANHPQEIAYLCSIAQPSVAVITNAGPVHLEGFGSLEGVRKSKGEIYQALPSDGIAIINADDEAAAYWESLLPTQTVIRFGLSSQAEVYATNIQLTETLHAQFDLHYRNQTICIHLPFIGEHQVPNALVAAAIGLSQHLTLDQIKMGLEAAQQVEQRGILQKGIHGVQVIDDSYNANPKALAAAINMLAALPHVKKRVLVLGDMGELGEDKLTWHAHVGHLAKKAGIDALYSVGELSQASSDAFGEGAEHFPNQAALVDVLIKMAHPDTCFLIKGSHSSHMNHVIEKLL